MLLSIIAALSLKKHNIGAMAGYEYFDAYNTGLAASGRLAPTDDFQDLELTQNTVAQQTRRNRFLSLQRKNFCLHLVG